MTRIANLLALLLTTSFSPGTGLSSVDLSCSVLRPSLSRERKRNLETYTMATEKGPDPINALVYA